ncbi:hypothetical protein AYI68_g7253 [Smittium mucronatum]|uniref:SH3 domain-containing protein n=1 Tax=Smittium mucronatum TaxID=133383 RepID=A0A1R0GP63_9FUNG|nr:hypothetical protein AYI68_g7253 [Smittium mucronatum]
MDSDNSTTIDVQSFDSLNLDLGKDSKISSLVSYEDGVYIGGAFSKFSNIAYYNGSYLSKLPNNGVNGRVNSMIFDQNYLYIGGEFNGTADSKVNGTSALKLNLNYLKNQGDSYFEYVDEEITGCIKSLYISNEYLSNSEKSLLLLGLNVTSHILNNNPSNNISIFNMDKKVWYDPPLVLGTPSFGFLSRFGLSLVGSFYELSSLSSNGISMLTTGTSNFSDNAWSSSYIFSLGSSPKSIYPSDSGEFTVSTSAIYRDEQVLLIAGLFRTSDGSKNIAKYVQSNNSWTSYEASKSIEFGNSVNGFSYGAVNKMFFADSYLIISGNQSLDPSYPLFNSNLTASSADYKTKAKFNGFSVWNFKDNSLYYNLGSIEVDSDPMKSNSSLFPAYGVINDIAINPEYSSVYVVGNFIKVDSVACKNICKFDLKKKEWSQVVKDDVSGDFSSLKWFNNTLYVSGEFNSTDYSLSNSYMLKITEGKNNDFNIIQDKSLSGIPGPVEFMGQTGTSDIFLFGSYRDDFETYFLASYNGKDLKFEDTSNIKINSVNGIEIIQNFNSSMESSFFPLMYGDFVLNQLGTNISFVSNCVALTDKGWVSFFKVSSLDANEIKVNSIFDLRFDAIVIKNSSSKKIIIIAVSVSSSILVLLIFLVLFITRRNISKKFIFVENFNSSKNWSSIRTKNSQLYLDSTESLSTGSDSKLLANAYVGYRRSQNKEKNTYEYKSLHPRDDNDFDFGDSQDYFSFQYTSELGTSSENKNILLGKISPASSVLVSEAHVKNPKDIYLSTMKIKPDWSSRIVSLQHLDSLEKEKTYSHKIHPVDSHELKLDSSLINLVDYFSQNPILNSISGSQTSYFSSEAHTLSYSDRSSIGIRPKSNDYKNKNNSLVSKELKKAPLLFDEPINDQSVLQSIIKLQTNPDLSVFSSISVSDKSNFKISTSTELKVNSPSSKNDSRLSYWSYFGTENIPDFKIHDRIAPNNFHLDGPNILTGTIHAEPKETVTLKSHSIDSDRLEKPCEDNINIPKKKNRSDSLFSSVYSSYIRFGETNSKMTIDPLQRESIVKAGNINSSNTSQIIKNLLRPTSTSVNDCAHHNRPYHTFQTSSSDSTSNKDILDTSNNISNYIVNPLYLNQSALSDSPFRCPNTPFNEDDKKIFKTHCNPTLLHTNDRSQDGFLQDDYKNSRQNNCVRNISDNDGFVHHPSNFQKNRVSNENRIEEFTELDYLSFQKHKSKNHDSLLFYDSKSSNINMISQKIDSGIINYINRISANTLTSLLPTHAGERDHIQGPESYRIKSPDLIAGPENRSLLPSGNSHDFDDIYFSKFDSYISECNPSRFEEIRRGSLKEVVRHSEVSKNLSKDLETHYQTPLLSGDVDTDTENRSQRSKRDSKRIVNSIRSSNSPMKKENLKNYPRYIAKYNFEPVEDSELELKIGDVVYILSENDGIWWAGAIDRGHDLPLETGVFPATYVQKTND